ncbi:MAG: hypothetical protein M3R24_39855 [Chloroflexota bacterium]|nr:hypothetical protein [Chloroflexota bacterium]
MTILAFVVQNAAVVTTPPKPDDMVRGGLLLLHIIVPLLALMVLIVVAAKVFFRIRPLQAYLDRPEYNRALRALLAPSDYQFVVDVVERQRAGRPVSGAELRVTRKLIISTLSTAGLVE